MLYDLVEQYPNAGPALLTFLLLMLLIALFWCIQSRWQREDEVEFWRKYRDDEARRLYKTRCCTSDLDHFCDPAEIDPDYHNRGDM